MIRQDRTRSGRTGDRGFTLIETLLAMTVTGIIVSSIAVAFSVIVKVSPDTEIRINDARSTRGLATWLASDTTSTPPFDYADYPSDPALQPTEGGFDVRSGPTAPNSCIGEGSNIVWMKLIERGTTDRIFITNFRFVAEGAEGRVYRYTCEMIGGNPADTSTMGLTSALDPANPPIANLIKDSSDTVIAMDLVLTATNGEQVVIETGSRNPVEFYS